MSPPQPTQPVAADRGASPRSTRRGPSSRSADRLLLSSAGASALLFVGLTAAHFIYQSQIALAQAADSLLDFITGTGLVWTLRISMRPPDEDHPFGHEDAQPIAGLAVAVLTGVLAVEVVRDAAIALVEGASLTLGWPLLGIMGAKVLIKLGFVLWARRYTENSTVVLAFKIDARNDVLVGVSSIVGLLAAEWLSIPALDAWLALPIGVWIAISGFSLAAESTHLLMGTAPPAKRQQELGQVAASVEGVVRVEALKARQHGAGLKIWIEIRVPGKTSVGEAHDLGDRVKQRLLNEPDVADVVVHIDAA